MALDPVRFLLALKRPELLSFFSLFLGPLAFLNFAPLIFGYILPCIARSRFRYSFSQGNRTTHFWVVACGMAGFEQTAIHGASSKEQDSSRWS